MPSALTSAGVSWVPHRLSMYDRSRMLTLPSVVVLSRALPTARRSPWGLLTLWEFQSVNNYARSLQTSSGLAVLTGQGAYRP